MNLGDMDELSRIMWEDAPQSLKDEVARMEAADKLAVPEFCGFPKIARFSRDIIITEKIDGTNAQVFVTDDGDVWAGSRKRWLTPAMDNFGFAQWVFENHDELLQLGPGRHFGEWYGQGIQRNYGLDHRRFALFNVTKWGDERPACCDVVPILYQGPLKSTALPWTFVDCHMDGLQRHGSFAAPGFMDPEGIVIYHTAANVCFKKTFEGDEGGTTGG